MSGRLILLCGVAGAGKTTLAKRLEVDGAVRMCPDEWLAALGFDIYDRDARVAERNRLLPDAARVEPGLVAFWNDRIERPDADELALFDPPTPEPTNDVVEP